MEKNEISKALKKILNEAGFTKLSVRGGRGTAWGWITIWCAKDGTGEFTEEQRNQFSKWGWNGGGNCLVGRLHEWEARVNRILEGTNPTLINLKELFKKVAQAQPDGGTCCLGSGLQIIKGEKIVDFIRNNWSQSSDSLVVAARATEEAFNAAGYSIYVEHGVMD